MTNEEAIAKLNEALSDILTVHPKSYSDAFNAAFDALGKQLPKRVLGRKGEFTKEDYKGMRYTYYGCPNCKKAVKHHTEYCDKCGQHLLFPFVSHTPYIQGEKQEVNLTWKDETHD